MLRNAEVVSAVVQGEQFGGQNVPVPRDSDGCEWGRKLVDLKGVAKPPEFAGEDSAWYEWKFRFSSVMSLLGILPAMLYVVDLPYPVRTEALSPEGRQKSSLLYNVLVQLTKG